MSFLKVNEKKGCSTSQVLSVIQVVPRRVLSSLNCLSTIVKGEIITGDTLGKLLLLAGFWLWNLKRGRELPFPSGLN